jgi:hypothetical protein
MLDLSHNTLDATDVTALLESPFLSRELTLWLASGDLDGEHLAALRSRFARVQLYSR